MTDLVFYMSTTDAEAVDETGFYPLSMDHVIDEKEKSLLICVQKFTFGSFIKKEIKIWFPKSAIQERDNLDHKSKTLKIHVKGWFLKKLLNGDYEYDF